MGQDLELDFEKYCVVDASPKTVLPSPHHSNLEKRKVRKKPKPKLRNEVASLSQNKEFTEITFNHYRSASCRTTPSIRLQVDEESPRRGSVYQSSIELTKMNRITEGRKKIAVSRRSDVPSSSEIVIVDSLCGSDEDNNNSVNSVNKENFSISIPLHKSLSSRLSIPQSPTKSDTSSKTRFSPFRKMFDPFTKSKSHKIEEPTPNEATTSSRKITLRKSLLNDFSNTDEGEKKVSCTSILSSSSSSAAHLSGILKLRNKNGMPYFEFSVKNPHDVWVAKTWNMGDGFNWVYTFHMAQNRRSSNVSGHGSSKDHHHHHRSKEFLMMAAQMQVSCYLCTELINPGAFNNSMLTEFVLYDLTRHSKETQIDQQKVNIQSSSNSISNPWPVKDLHPDLETAAIVLQFPLKHKEGGDMRNHDLETSTPTRVNVVIPSGNHGLPGGEAQAQARGASRLLDRWRMGGGCDCGGWDMGCPLVVFGSHDLKNSVEIFFKGSKEKMPGLTMKLTEEGQYVVEFHAQLSSLQAFSICVAILHGTEASIVAGGGDVKRKILKCDSLRVFIEDQVKHLIEAVAEGQKGKSSSKNLDEISPTFLVNPPFSPMSRA